MSVMYLEGAGWRFNGLRTSQGTWSRKLLWEATRTTHVLLSHAMVAAGGLSGGGLVMFGSRQQVWPLEDTGCGRGSLTRSRPQSTGGTRIRSPLGRGAFAVGGGERGLLMFGDTDEGVEEDISDASAGRGHLDEGGCPDGLAGA